MRGGGPVVRVGFLCSHGGSAMRAVLDAIAAGTLTAEATVAISNNSGAPALGAAAAAGLPTYHLRTATHPDAEELDAAIRDALVRHGNQVVLLSGYLKKIGPLTLDRFRGHVLNTHPALLPDFGGHGMYGDRVHRAVLAAGRTVTGATVHVVDEHYDHGTVLRQKEALQERVQGVEASLVAEVLSALGAGTVRLPVRAL